MTKNNLNIRLATTNPAKPKAPATSTPISHITINGESKLSLKLIMVRISIKNTPKEVAAAAQCEYFLASKPYTAKPINRCKLATIALKDVMPKLSIANCPVSISLSAKVETTKALNPVAR